MMAEKVSTTVSLDSEVWKEARMVALILNYRGGAGEVVEESLKMYLAEVKATKEWQTAIAKVKIQ